MNKCFLLRASLLLSLLCVCAHVYVELKGLCLTAAVRLQKQTPNRRHQKAVTRAPLADAASTCCRPLKHHRRIPRWKIDLEPWAAETHDLQEEADRFLRYISTPQVSCERPASALPVFDREDHGSWVLCLDRRFSLAERIASKHCRVYSLSANRLREHQRLRAELKTHYSQQRNESFMTNASGSRARLTPDFRADPPPAKTL
ncbi:Methyltransferase-like protein 24 [Anabarilius grahami]|uniref:Methyltransferase-like protein 24 n=1 Tax=Anabarilius grahami TaxID=495550 RepID=A0A3N0YWG1_ANAGA|nr:Methyltransferase-like protein 24 [Anabarilius grahami]